jgi:hypothetical protein
VQSFPTLAAQASVKVSSQVPLAGRTPPVVIGEADECGNHNDLSRENRAPGVCPEPPRARVEYGEDDEQQHCRRNRDTLAPLALRELSPDLPPAPTHRPDSRKVGPDCQFDSLAVTNAAWLKEKAVSGVEDGMSSIWLPFVDTYRTLCMVPGQELRRVQD